ncbi:transcriptional co-activator mating type protein alpha NDAI_0A00100 [Naumovozyma dairenensis CBS 421]|uniref:Alpha box domain-containing protein n=1 Tax=Naumovozyma dairenensis (strain ATCC 10597 / BCRC 20456 / CBS 421 / NBRC 0211 / NRRL Y-12639) TaxID=1071378 RepID=G0W5F6_NAUDC|nr:hypothetical protein NDAI_0A00100 [Naumovozyma dairenensis CBS 421]CCD22170.1 hypothetical protein NDAI_0A00100 [Naumovozyma dairenensis CBS 421]
MFQYYSSKEEAGGGSTTTKMVPPPPKWFLDSINFEHNPTTRLTYFQKESILRPYQSRCYAKSINGFMLFRSYYSQYGKGLKQSLLSPLLSKLWNAHETDQLLWDQFAQQCNAIGHEGGICEDGTGICKVVSLFTP